MKISFVSPGSPLDVKQWSGTISNMAKALEKSGVELDCIYDFEKKALVEDYLRYAKSKISTKKYIRTYNPKNLKYQARHVEQRIKSDSVAIFSTGSRPLAYVQSKLPKFFYTDACFASMEDYYPEFTNLDDLTLRRGHDMEKRALANVDLAFYSSSWAAEAAVRAYGIPESKVRVIPFGANLDSEEAPADVARYIQAKSRSSCNLLFVGVDWKRKGLDVALETAAYLNQQGYPAKLHVVGAKDLDPSTLPDYVVFHGFLSKDQPEESARLKQLYETAHFLIVPSRAEAFGIVYSEASSYGVPSLSFASGGITTAIKNGENGQTFSLNADGTAFGEYVLKMMNDPAAYEALAANSFRRYQAELNWTVAGRFLIKSISQFI